MGLQVKAKLGNTRSGRLEFPANRIDLILLRALRTIITLLGAVPEPSIT